MVQYQFRREDFAVLKQKSSLLSLDPPLPQTISDAMQMVQRIGEMYLWVETLCIDHADVVEFQAQLRHMGDFYGGVVLMIIAANGADVASELAPSSLYSMSSGRASRMEQIKPGLEMLLVDRLDNLLLKSPWGTRAWT